MHQRLCQVVLGVAIGACPVTAQSPAETWTNLSQAAFDPEKSAAAHNLTLARDRLRLTFVDGAMQFTKPVEGVVFGAAFTGRGRVQIEPPNAAEAQQLRLFTGKDTLDMEFSEATLTFTDGAYEELAAQLQWSPKAGPEAARLYQSRQQAREGAAAELLPRVFKGVLSADRKRTAFFSADLHTRERGWMHVRVDALEPEEVLAGRWVDRVGAKTFDTWLAFPAGNRGAGEAFRDPLAKQDYQTRSYRIEAAIAANAQLRAVTQVDLEARAAGERVLRFELDSNLRVESVKLLPDTTLPFFQPRDPGDKTQSYGDYVAVVLPQPSQAGQKHTIEFRYGGRRVVRKVGAGNYFCQSYGWYPAQPGNFALRANFEMTFRYPKQYALVATGSRISQSTDGGTAISTWKSDIPLPVVGFAFGDYKLHTEKVGAIDVEIYANTRPDDVLQSVLTASDSPLPTRDGAGMGASPALGSLSPAALTKTMGAEIGNTLRLFEEYFGPYPYRRLAVTNIPYSYGQGWPSLLYLSALSFLDSTQRQGLGITSHIELTDFFRAHEASHQWWGHRVGWKSYHDQWLSEGFAEFSGNLYVQNRRNEKEYLDRLRRDKQELLARDQHNRVYESLGPVWMGQRLASSESTGGYNMVVYKKGGLILHMLRMMLTDPRNPKHDARFIAMMQDYCQTFNNQPASTEDFKAVVEKHMIPQMDVERNGRMDWFFRQYVYGTGTPQYQFRYTVQDAGGGKWKVAGTVTPRAPSPGWKDILRVYLHTSGRLTRLAWIQVSDEASNFEFELPLKPEKLTLNDYEDTLAEIRQ